MKLHEWIETNRDEMIGSLQGCIRIPSVYAQGSPYPFGENAHRCLAYMLELGRKMGFETVNMDEYLGWCEYGQGDEMVAVLCHLDVVPEGEGWTVPPYEGCVQDGRIYGRGAIDDKGPAVAALYALQAVQQSGATLKRRVRLMFGLNEESGSADMAYYRQHGGEIPIMGFTPDGMYPLINGEKGVVAEGYVRPLHQCGEIRLLELQGGAALNIVPAHAHALLACPPKLAKQIAAMQAEKITCTLTENGVRVEAKGAEAHASTPEEGENAIGRLALFLHRLPLEGDLARAVELLAEKFGMETDGRSLGIAMEDELSGALTMNLGLILGNEDQLQVGIDCRYPVTHRSEEFAGAIEKAFAAAGFQRARSHHGDPLYIAPDSPLVRTLLKVYSDYTGEDAAPICIGGGTYAKAIPNILAFGPLFPGDAVREHKPDEFIEIERLMDNAKIMAMAICELAGGETL